MTRPGTHIFVSGQVARDERREIVGPNDRAAQTRKALENIEIAVQSVGGTVDDIVMVRISIVNDRNPDGAIVCEALRERFGLEAPHAGTWLDGVSMKPFPLQVSLHVLSECATQRLLALYSRLHVYQLPVAVDKQKRYSSGRGIAPGKGISFGGADVGDPN